MTTAPRTSRAVHRTLATLAASALVAASLLVASPASAGCPTTGCDGTDPINTQCSADARNATSQPAYIMKGATTLAVVELRYSATCGTNWGKISNRVTPNRVQVTAYRDSPRKSTPWYGGTGAQYYGDQLDGQNSTICAVGEVVYNGTTYTSTPLCA
ncbi:MULTISPECIES: DUF2690 domain-containing protein [unclassified Micromonospora]|uniref:DUF2690 domain-containing protein n=1 Tax=unclassified Micromonospora TaxID=2617518 RepID=UPI001C5F8991|nr:DUF2690 domain-containing protein [Micromonospora sp. RL09-050-HVF-A]MBW4705278.1 DUF2690 domain-containing protein [Micromonospora sp. RL09-050-HVF-A]